MAPSSGRKVKRDGVFLGTLILTIALGIIIWQYTDSSAWMLLLVPLIGIGAFLTVMSFAVPSVSRVGPSLSSYYMVWGILLLTVGILGVVKMTYDVDWIIIGAAFLVVFALLIIWRSVSRRD